MGAVDIELAVLIRGRLGCDNGGENSAADRIETVYLRIWILRRRIGKAEQINVLFLQPLFQLLEINDGINIALCPFIALGFPLLRDAGAEKYNLHTLTVHGADQLPVRDHGRYDRRHIFGKGGGVDFNQVIHARAAGCNDILHASLHKQLLIFVRNIGSSLGRFADFPESKLQEGCYDLAGSLILHDAKIGRSD